MSGADNKPKKLNHFVARLYLRAWAQREKLHCLQDGEIRHPNIKGLGAENYFYKLHELTNEDLEFLEHIITDSPSGLQSHHRRILANFNVPFLARGFSAEAQIACAVREINEDLHTIIEEDFKQYLKEMTSGSLDFLKEPAHASRFYAGLSAQYMRTHHIKKVREMMSGERYAQYQRLVGPLTHILAANLGLSLYAERGSHRIVLLDNLTNVPFVTADQPIINLSAGPNDTAPPTRFELYYPLSPKKAMLLLEPSTIFDPGSTSVSEALVEMYNLGIAAHSFRQVFASESLVLESVRAMLPAYLSCFPNN